jgi:hypothetical protein
MRKGLAFTAVAAVAVAGGIAFATLSSSPEGGPPITANAPVTDPVPAVRQIAIWRDAGCGCCDAYARYLEANGYGVTLIDDRNFDQRSIAAGVPPQGLGCHLAQIDGYYISGLVPVEIIERLLTERPDIIGITLPGMPANAPGMAVQKTGTLMTYAFGQAGVTVYANE